MNRRQLLASLAAGAVAVPGCLDDANGAGDGSPSATSTRPSTGTVPDGAVEETPSGTPARDGTGTGTETDVDFVREAFAVPELVAPDSPDSFGVYGDRDEQYVVALLAAQRGAAPPASDVELVADGEPYPAETEVGGQGWALFDYDASYSPDDDRGGWVVFRLPKPLEAGGAAVSWPGGEDALGDEVLARLARPPASFAVESFDAPAAVDAGETVTATVTVENTGDADGTFVAAFNRSGPLIAYAPESVIRLPVAASETETWTFEHAVADESFEEDRPMRLYLHWRDDSLSRQVTVRAQTDDGTTDGTETQPTPTGTRGTRTRAATEALTADDGTSTETRSGTPTPLDE